MTSTSRKLVQEFIVPAGEARAFMLKKGQVLRIVEVEGKQVADIVFLNAHDYKEAFHAGHTVVANQLQGIGTITKPTKLYSHPARENVMLTVIDDKVGVHFAHQGTRCSKLLYEIRGQKGHRNCQDHLAKALEPYGLAPEDVPDVFNLWMNVDIENGRFIFKPSLADKGDYIDLLAEMDLLVAISACPQDLTPINDYKLKSLGVQIYD